MQAEVAITAGSVVFRCGGAVGRYTSDVDVIISRMKENDVRDFVTERLTRS